MHKRLAITLIACIGALCIPSIAFSQPAGEEKIDVDALFQKAQEDFNAEKYKEALVSLEKIHAVEPDPVITYNIARCHQELEHWDEAETFFEDALAEEGLPDPLREEATGHLQTVVDKKAEEEARKQAELDKKKPPPEEPDPPASLATGYVGAHVGVVVPQLFTDLGSWPIFGVEAGYVLPFDAGPFIRPVVLAFDILYTAPGAEGDGQDANLGPDGAGYDWELTEQMLILELTAAWRFMPMGEFLSAYVQVGPRLYLLESVLTAKGNGADFGEHSETDTNTGFVGAGGLDIQLGPGSLFGALEIGYSGLDQKITGESNTGNLNVELGYRLQF